MHELARMGVHHGHCDETSSNEALRVDSHRQPSPCKRFKVEPHTRSALDCLFIPVTGETGTSFNSKILSMNAEEAMCNSQGGGHTEDHAFLHTHTHTHTHTRTPSRKQGTSGFILHWNIYWCQMSSSYSCVRECYVHLDLQKPQVQCTHFRKNHDPQRKFQSDSRWSHLASDSYSSQRALHVGDAHCH